MGSSGDIKSVTDDEDEQDCGENDRRIWRGFSDGRSQQIHGQLPNGWLQKTLLEENEDALTFFLQLSW